MAIIVVDVNCMHPKQQDAVQRGAYAEPSHTLQAIFVPIKRLATYTIKAARSGTSNHPRRLGIHADAVIPWPTKNGQLMETW